MTIINRRALMGGIAVLPAVPAAAAIEGALPLSAEDRLRHHLAMARQAMDELVSEPGSRWWITIMGSAEAGTASFRAHRFIRVKDPEISWLTIERCDDVCEGRL